MQRRTFFLWSLWSWAAQWVLPRAAAAQSAPAQPAAAVGFEPQLVRALAGVVLPAGLGRDGLDAASTRFVTWVREYKAGAEMSAGYGKTRQQTVPPDPSRGYAAQLAALDAEARRRGAAFAQLAPAEQREVVEGALAASGADRLPRRPDGRHIAADLLSHFFFISSEGEDWLYNAAIRRDTCRGLDSSGERPAPLRG